MNKEAVNKFAIRLAEKLCDLYEHCSRVGKTDCHKCQLEHITYQTLARFMIENEQGMAINVPLKNGDIAWGIRNFHGHFKPVKGYISNATIEKDLRVLYEIKYVCRGYFGEKIFKAKEDAEAEIVKMEKNKNVSR